MTGATSDASALRVLAGSGGRAGGTPARDATAVGLHFEALGARETRHASTSSWRYPTRPGEMAYEHFEGGFGPLNVERVHAVSELLEVDPYGVLTAIEICSPDFALRTADNKLMTMFYLQLQGFDERTGDAITLLDAYCLLDAFQEMFAKLEAEAERRKALIARRPSKPPPGGEDEDG